LSAIRAEKRLGHASNRRARHGPPVLVGSSHPRKDRGCRKLEIDIGAFGRERKQPMLRGLIRLCYARQSSQTS
jgi:hypothetical protein